MAEVSAILADLFVIVLAARLAGEVFGRLGQPPALGGLLAGVLLGPHALGLLGVPRPELVEAFGGDAAAGEAARRLVFMALAGMGAAVLLLAAGLEVRLSDLRRVAPRALRVGGLGLALPLALGVGLLALRPAPPLTAAAVAAALAASSVGVTAGVLRGLGVPGTAEARVVLGAAALDAVLALLLLTAAVALGGAGGAAPWGLALALALAVAFVAFVASGERVRRRVERLPVARAPGALVGLLTLGLAAAAAAVGPAALAGALLVGAVLAEARDAPRLARQARPLVQVLGACFFVLTGAAVDPGVLGDPGAAAWAAALTVLAVAGKLAGGILGAWGGGGPGAAPRRRRSAVTIGVGIVPRGEVGLLVAAAGRAYGAVPDPVFAAVVLMSLVTTLLAPPLLARLHRTWPGTLVPEAAGGPAAPA